MSGLTGEVKFVEGGTVKCLELIGEVKFVEGGTVKCLSSLER